MAVPPDVLEEAVVSEEVVTALTACYDWTDQRQAAALTDIVERLELKTKAFRERQSKKADNESISLEDSSSRAALDSRVFEDSPSNAASASVTFSSSPSRNASDLSAPEDSSGRTIPSWDGSNDELDDEVGVYVDLLQMFPMISYEEVLGKYRDNDNDYRKTVDELLNACFLEVQQNERSASRGGIEASPAKVKGIDGFAADEDGSPGQKRGRRKKRQEPKDNWSSKNSDEPASTTFKNPWANYEDEIAFLTERGTFTEAELWPRFKKYKGSLPKVLLGLLQEESIKMDSAGTEELYAQSVAVLAAADSKLARRLLAPLLKLTNGSQEYAYQILQRYQELLKKEIYNKPEIEDEWITPEYKSYRPSSTPPRAHFSSAAPLRYDSPDIARRTALVQAASLYRRSNANNHLGGAAAYYGEEARAIGRQLRSIRAAEADQLAMSQSTRTSVDLHGLDVKNGIRISRERVRQWWIEAGERLSEPIRGMRARELQEAFEVITGKGLHSAGGIGKLGPAVVKALSSDGWRVEVGQGTVFVLGKK